MSPPSVYKSVYDAVVEDGELAPAKVAPVNYEGHAYNLGLPAGQWSMSAADYVRLLMSLDVPGELLNAAHIQEITQTSFAQSWTLGFYAPALPAVMSLKDPLMHRVKVAA
jgi:hypothetical protein